jgi:hypothetical protein
MHIANLIFYVFLNHNLRFSGVLEHYGRRAQESHAQMYG